MATEKENKRKRVGPYLALMAGSVVLAGIYAALAIPRTALAAKGSGGKKGAEFIQVMADFVAGNAVDSDGGGRISPFPSCGAGHPTGGLWDYWDSGYPDSCGGSAGDGGTLKCSLSGGGSWTLNTSAQGEPEVDRWVVFHWDLIKVRPGFADSAVDDASNPDLDQLIYQDNPDVLPGGFGGPDVDTTIGVDNLNIRFNADMVFKDTASRQPLTIRIQYGKSSGPMYDLNYLDPLYIERDPGDPDVAYLTTFDPSGNADADVHEAELVELVDPTTGESHKGNSKPVVGIYSMPFQVILRRVYIP